MPFTLPNLGFDHAALEPYIDSETMHIHHEKHHGTYVANLNKALEGLPESSYAIEDVVKQIPRLPETIQTAVRNNAGGHFNHTLLWLMLSPGGAKRPSGSLGSALDRDCGGYDNFKTEITKVAMARFGSGWAWLALGPDKTLRIESTPNQDSPLTDGRIPVLGIDVWEHAYYLKYQNKRAEYLDAFFHVINWTVVQNNFEKAAS